MKLLSTFLSILLLAARGQPGQPTPTPVPQQTTLTFACFSWLLDDYERLAEAGMVVQPPLKALPWLMRVESVFA